jgi:hypothetical protein
LKHPIVLRTFWLSDAGFLFAKPRASGFKHKMASLEVRRSFHATTNWEIAKNGTTTALTWPTVPIAVVCLTLAPVSHTLSEMQARQHLFHSANYYVLDALFGGLASLEEGWSDGGDPCISERHFVNHGAFFGLHVLDDIIVSERRRGEQACNCDGNDLHWTQPKRRRTEDIVLT